MLPLPRLGWYNLSIEAEKAIKALGINRRMLRQLHWRFDDIDTGGQGQITKVSRRLCLRASLYSGGRACAGTAPWLSSIPF